MKTVYLLVIIPLFIINPFATVTFMLFFTMLHKIDEDRWLKLLMSLLVLFVWSMQMSRLLSYSEPSDWGESYCPMFLDAEWMNFIDYLYYTSREPVFQVLNYAGYYLTGGNFILFASTMVAMMHGFVYAGIYKYWKSTGTNVNYLIAALVIFTFMIENFAFTNNILRQQIAIGIMIYVIATKVVDGKINWWLALFACFTHSFMFLFLAVLFIKPMYGVIRWKQLAMMGGVIVILALLFSQVSFFLDLFSSFGMLSYGLKRLGKLDEGYVGTDVMENSFLLYASVVVLVICFLKMNYWDKPRKKEATYVNLLTFLIIGCVLLKAVNPLLQTRLYCTRFFFFPFVLPFFFRNNSWYSQVYLYGIIIFFYSRFFLLFDSKVGIFFPPIDNLIAGNLFQYLY